MDGSGTVVHCGYGTAEHYGLGIIEHYGSGTIEHCGFCDADSLVHAGSVAVSKSDKAWSYGLPP